MQKDWTHAGGVQIAYWVARRPCPAIPADSSTYEVKLEFPLPRLDVCKIPEGLVLKDALFQSERLPVLHHQTDVERRTGLTCWGSLPGLELMQSMGCMAAELRSAPAEPVTRGGRPQQAGRVRRCRDGPAAGAPLLRAAAHHGPQPHRHRPRKSQPACRFLRPDASQGAGLPATGAPTRLFL